jgi:hypothetical protein
LLQPVVFDPASAAATDTGIDRTAMRELHLHNDLASGPADAEGEAADDPGRRSGRDNRKDCARATMACKH